MGYTLKVNHPHFPEGKEMNVGGIGRVPNGSSIEVDEEMERLFMLQHGRTLNEAFENDGVTDISGSSALDKSESDSILAMFTEPETEETAPTPDEPFFNRTTTTSSGTPDDEGGEE